MSQDDRRPKTEDRLRVVDDGRRVTDDRQSMAADGKPKTDAAYEFQRLDVYRLALDYLDEEHALTYHMPDVETFNLRGQIERAVA